MAKTETKAVETKKDDDKKQIIIKGVLKSAFTHQKKNDDGAIISETNVLILFPDGQTIDGMDFWEFFDGFFAGKGSKWVPNWYKEKNGITLKSEYNIPILITDTEERLTFSEYVERGLIRDAEVSIKCNVKESAVYPSAMKVIKDGTEYDAFADF